MVRQILSRRYAASELALIAVSLVSISCGAAPGGAETAVSPASATFLLRGRIEAPTLALASLTLSNTRFSSDKDGKESAIKGDVYTLEGKHLGEFETDAEGFYQVNVPYDSSEQTVVVTTEIGIQQCGNVTPNTNGGSVNLGTADIGSSLATAAMAQQIPEFNGWGEDNDNAQMLSGQFDCLYQISESLWGQANANAGTLKHEFGLIKNSTAHLLAQGKKPEDWGYGNWNGLLSDMLSGNMNNPEVLNALHADGLYLNSSLDASGDLSGVGAVQSSMNEFLSALVAEDYAADLTGEGHPSFCNSIATGDLDPDVIVAPLLEANDLEEFNTVYGGELAAKLHVGIMQDCLEQDDCNDVKENAATILKVLKEYQGDYTEFFANENSPDKKTFQDVVVTAKACDTGSDAEEEECAKDDYDKTHEKVVICHIPPGNPANAHAIEVSTNAVPAHLAHGDNLGECAADDTSGDNEVELIPAVDEETLIDVAEEILDTVESETIESAVEEIIAAVEDPETAPLAVAALDDIATEAAQEAAETSDNDVPQTGDVVEMNDPEYDILVQAATSDLDEESAEPTPEISPVESEDPGFSVAWQYQFGYIYGGFYRMIPGPSAAIGDVRPGVAGLEVATGNEEYFPLGWGGPLGRWFLFSSVGAVQFWKDTENDEAHSSVNLYDLNHDGTLDLLGGTTSGNQVQAFDGQAHWLWRHTLLSHSISTPAVADLGHGPKVFNGSMDGYVRGINGETGQLNWSFYSGDWIWASAAVADLDGDTHQEVVIAGYNGKLHCFNAETGQIKWETNLGYNTRASAALADVDSDGILEVLVGDGNGVFWSLSGATGAVEWSFTTGGSIQSSAAVGDLDGNGTLEIVFGSADGNVYALNGDGSLFWSRNLGGMVYSSPALARRVPGATLHVYVATMAGDLAVINGTSGVIAAKMAVGYEIVSSPVVGDVNGDGKLEVFFQDRRAEHFGMQGDMFWAVKDEGSSVPPYAREWPVFRGNPEHTGVYHGN